MKLLRVTKIVPVRDEKFVLLKWEYQGEVRLYPGNVEFVVKVEEMGGKTQLTMRSGAHFFVDEGPDEIDRLIAEATK